MARSERCPSNPSSFSRIWSVVARIPRGRVATYGQIARMAGLGGGARTAGWAMQALPDGLRIERRAVPWHRVINAAGVISPRGGDPEALAVLRQAARLRREGVRVTGKGKIDLERYRWWPGENRPSPRRRGRTGRGPQPT
jgi:methylated-DNA-protein-cysteine methyltransferase-like protein